MRFFALLMLLAMALAGCSTETLRETPQTGSEETTPSTSNSDAADSASASTEESKVVIIDVRSKEEWNSGHVEQAVHIPHTEIADRISEVTEDKGARIVLYCAVGGRAGRAKARLEELGYTNVENGGGYDDVKSRFE